MLEKSLRGDDQQQDRMFGYISPDGLRFALHKIL
ncbi:MAG: hypothetical protein JWQ87_5388 [Candidatus Sulfotelmatobacter sp.]|nr:hypothetical protein [Candidatus Sulfotelmatobacter sp.]